jgi:hypothetical protein
MLFLDAFAGHISWSRFFAWHWIQAAKSSGIQPTAGALAIALDCSERHARRLLNELQPAKPPAAASWRDFARNLED